VLPALPPCSSSAILIAFTIGTVSRREEPWSGRLETILTVFAAAPPPAAAQTADGPRAPGSPCLDPFWARAQELRTPISLHAITGMGWESQWNFSDRYMRGTVLPHEIERSFSVLIFSGVLDRFPELQIVSAENNCGWLPYYLQRMDRTFERGRYAAGFKLSLKPSEYFQRQMYCTYIDDYVGVANRHFVGVDKLMWSSDYPHQASSWPHSQEVVARDFKDASADDQFKITRGNVAKLYRFEL